MVRSPIVSIICLNWNGWQDTIACLESIYENSYPNYRVIVVDNGSTDDSRERIVQWAQVRRIATYKYVAVRQTSGSVDFEEAGSAFDKDRQRAISRERIQAVSKNGQLILINNGMNLGFAAGNNVGIRYAMMLDSDFIMLLNNDTVVEPHALESLANTLLINQGWMAVGPKILYKDNPETVWYAGSAIKLCRANVTHVGMNKPDDIRLSGIHTTDHVSACCFLGRRELFDTLGLLDEDYFFIHEDWDYSCRAKKYGMTFGVNLDAIIYHRVRGSQTKDGENLTATYYSNKHRLLLLKKHGTTSEKITGATFYLLTRLVKFPVLLASGKLRPLSAEVRAIIDFFAGRYGEYDMRRANAQ